MFGTSWRLIFGSLMGEETERKDSQILGGKEIQEETQI